MSASIASVNWVNYGDVVIDLTPMDSPVDSRMASAILEGAYSAEEQTLTAPFDCPTGNCDFPRYSSLGYCSSCVDITSLVQEQYDPMPPLPYSYRWNYTIPGEDCTLDFLMEFYNYTLTRAITNSPPQLSFCPSPLVSDFGLVSNFTTSSFIWSDCPHYFDDWDSNDPFCGLRPGQLPSLVSSSGLVALNCTLGLCVWDYTSRVRNGELDETVTNSLSSSYQIHESEPTIVKLPCTVDSKYYDISNISQVPSIPGRNFTAVTFDGQRVIVPMECVFKTGRETLFAIWTFLKREVFGLREKDTRGSSCTLQLNSSICEPWYLESMFHRGELTAEMISSGMDRIAIAISNRIRAVGTNSYRNGSGITLGTAIQTTVCVRVDWAWLLFPGVLVLLTVLLLVCVLLMERTIYEEQPNWKSSALVGFFHRIDAGPHTADFVGGGPAPLVASARRQANAQASSSPPKRESEGDLMSLESMHEKAKKIVVKLETAAAAQRGFFTVGEEELIDRGDPTDHSTRRSSTGLNHDGEALPVTQLPSIGSLDRQAPSYLHVDLGTGLTSSIRSSLDPSNQHDLEGSHDREV